MKKITILVLVLLTFGLITPVFAAPGPPTDGVQVNMFTPDQTLIAGEPFFIRHGWTLTEGNSRGMGALDFNIIIEGVPVDPGFRYITVDPETNETLVLHLYNFSQGLPEGTYTIYGFWYLQCIDGSHPDTCTNPYQSVANAERTVTLVVTP